MGQEQRMHFLTISYEKSEGKSEQNLIHVLAMNPVLSAEQGFTFSALRSWFMP